MHVREEGRLSTRAGDAHLIEDELVLLAVVGRLRRAGGQQSDPSIAPVHGSMQPSNRTQCLQNCFRGRHERAGPQRWQASLASRP